MNPPETQLRSYRGAVPRLASDCWVAPSASLIGDVELKSRASVWYSSVLRGDGDRIEIGAGSNIQDGCVVHADPGIPALLGSGVSVGHRAVLHGCTIADDVLVGMGAILLNGVQVGSESLIAAGSVVLEGTRIPAGSLVAGVPARVKRPLTDAERQAIHTNASTYLDLARHHASEVTS